MRTFEEIVENNYKKLTFGEMLKYDIGCDCCPLINSYCSGGISSNGGGEPLEPPCCAFDYNTIIEEVYNDYVKAEIKKDEYRKQQYIKLKAKQEKQQKLKEKRAKYINRNFSDINKTKQLNKQISNIRKEIKKFENSRLFAMTINETNKIFRECNCNCPQDIKINNNFINIKEKEIAEIQLNIKQIKQDIKYKEKIFKLNKLGEK